MSSFNIKKTLTLSAHAGLFWYFNKTPHFDMDYRIFNVHVLSFGMRIRTGNSVYSLTLRTFVVCTEFDSGEISGLA